MKINQIVGEATGDPLGTVSAAPDASGKIKIKTPTGTEIETTKDALLPGAKPGTVQMKPDAAGDQLKPGTQVVSAEAMGDISTMPTTEFVKGIYAAAAENGMDAPDVEAVKKQMVLAPNGEVDIIATMQKAVQVFQSPEWKQMLADLDALVKRAEAQQPNAELSRIQELAGISEASNDTNDAIHAWNDKYSKYSGTNGPDLVNGWIDGMTSSGIISDGWEENEVYELEQRLGKEMGEWEPEDYDYVSDNEDTLLPISTAMVEELASILGVDAVGEEEANQVANILYGSTDESTGELDRIKKLSGLKGEDISFNGVTQHANGDMSYNQGPLSMRQNKDGSSDMTANIGNTTARVQQNPIGVKTLTAQGPEADSINSVDASADRKGVDPKKFASFRKQNPAAVKESPELIAMLSIAGLR